MADHQPTFQSPSPLKHNLAESPSSPSSKALKPLSSSSSPSPITTIDQPITYENYQPYVLVKGSMDEPWCSKDEQRKLCIEKTKSTLSQVQKRDEKGIVLDEVSCLASSSTIPFELHSKGIEFSQLQAKSVPSSPTKVNSTSSRRIEKLRAAILQMKECSQWQETAKKEEGAEPAFSYLPLELWEEEDFASQVRGEYTSELSMNSKLELVEYESKKKMHLKSLGLHVVEHPSYYPIKKGASGQYPSQVKPTTSTFQPSLPQPTLPTVQTFKPMDKTQDCPPTSYFSNFSLLAGDYDPFPPLRGSHLSRKDQNPPGKSSSPPSPRAPWSQLFNSNRVKTNGTTLEYLPNQKPGDKPTIEITHEKVTGELER